MQPFNLELAQRGHPVQLLSGHLARIICFDRRSPEEGPPRPIVALISYEDREDVDFFTKEGYFRGLDGAHNLVMAPVKKVGLHVDDFIDFGTGYENRKDEVEARWFFLLHRFSAILQMDFAEKIKPYKLFCTYQDVRYRVTGASRMGDVWLTPNMAQEVGYKLRVDVTKCSKWETEK